MWRVEHEGNVYIKVIGFPCPQGGDMTESMWVRKISGTDDDGTGELTNDPVVCTAVKRGDIIRFSGGTERLKPRFTPLVISDSAVTLDNDPHPLRGASCTLIRQGSGGHTGLDCLVRLHLTAQVQHDDRLHEEFGGEGPDEWHRLEFLRTWWADHLDELHGGEAYGVNPDWLVAEVSSDDLAPSDATDGVQAPGWQWQGFRADYDYQGYVTVSRVRGRHDMQPGEIVLLATSKGGREDGSIMLERPDAPKLERPPTVDVAWPRESGGKLIPFNPFADPATAVIWQALVIPRLLAP